MAEGARVIQMFPAAAPRTCHDCVWQSESSDSSGVWSTCTLFVEDIHDETVAETCEGWGV